MRVLVVYGSKYGSTRGIAEAIGGEFERRGHAADVHEAADAPPPGGYGAAVIGSGVYLGSWLPAAAGYLDAHLGALADLPVWLFSSGPLGHDEPQPAGDPAQVPQLMAKVGARGHVTLTGRLDRSALRWSDRLIARAVKAPDGDFRDWDAIRTWATAIAVALDGATAADALLGAPRAPASTTAAAPRPTTATTPRPTAARGGPR